MRINIGIVGTQRLSVDSNFFLAVAADTRTLVLRRMNGGIIDSGEGKGNAIVSDL